MNTLNPNIYQMLQSQTGFSKNDIMVAFDMLKKIEEISAREFILTQEKFVTFVTRCKERGWNCNKVSSRLCARTIGLYSQSWPPHGETHEFHFYNF